MPYQNFEDLDVWKKARQLKLAISELTDTFPKEEKFRLTDQLIRSSRSIGVQVAEGHGRQTFPDGARFCIIARGSLSETLAHLIDAFDENYITEEQINKFRIIITEVEKLLNGYINWLEKKPKEK
jgi:four helix bundle protein